VSFIADRRCVAVFFFWFLVVPVMAAAGDMAPSMSSPGEVRELQEKMTNDGGIMALIASLQNDPEMQALLSDPKVLKAVQAGDLGALLNDPRIMKLLDNPQVKEIGKRLDKDAEGKR